MVSKVSLQHIEAAEKLLRDRLAEEEVPDEDVQTFCLFSVNLFAGGRAKRFPSFM